MMNFRYKPGDIVCIKWPAIPGVVERCIWSRGMAEPLYLVQFWNDREFRTIEVCEGELCS